MTMHDTNDDPKLSDSASSLRNQPTGDVDPATQAIEEDDEARLPEAQEEAVEPIAEGTLASGRAAIARSVKLATASAKRCHSSSFRTSSA